MLFRSLPEEGLKAAAVKQKELNMAIQLIESMSEQWDPTQFKDTFREDIMALVEKKAKEGKGNSITTPEPEAAIEEGEQDIDLVELLKRSLQGMPSSAQRRTGNRKIPSPAHRATRTRSRTAKTAH